MPSSLESSSPFPAVRRIVTGHTVDGKSTVLADTVLPPRFWTPESIAPTYDIHYTGESPANNDSEIRAGGKWVDEVAEQKDLVSKDGATFRSWDFAPGSVTVCGCTLFSGWHLHDIYMLAVSPHHLRRLWDRRKRLCDSRAR
jgi:hypothetical protein